MVSERVWVVFRASTRADEDGEATGASASEPGGRWLVEVEVDLEGVTLDPEYWLRHCQGFLVDSEAGEELGVVDDVELSRDSERAVALVVVSGWFGRHAEMIDVADVQAIVPSQRRLIVQDTTRAADAERRRA